MLLTNTESLRAEIMDVLRMFGAETEDFTHYFSAACGKFFNSIEYRGNFYDFEEEYKAENELVFRRLAKRACKLAFYKVLSGAKNVSLPWGALTGIRPTKLAYAELAAGRDFKELFNKLCVGEENTELIEAILRAQKGLYKKGGQDVFVSVPFCPTKCDYCSFITAPLKTTEYLLEDYLKCLAKELYGIKPFIKNLRSVYIGGGTPFVLNISQLTSVYAAINAFYDHKAEYTVEAGRPDVFTEDKLKLSKDNGVTRTCVNPQSFNDRTLEKIGRKHTAAQTLKAYEDADKFGFDINLDLIAGLADESVQDFEKSLDTAISLAPANITVHTLSLKSGAKLKEEVKKLEIAGVADMIASSREKLTVAGYEPYYLYRQKYQAGGLENTGWTKKGKACVYNIDVMEEISDNIAVGANAISKKYYGEEDRIERHAAPKDIPSYINKCDRLIEERIKLFGGTASN